MKWTRRRGNPSTSDSERAPAVSPPRHFAPVTQKTTADAAQPSQAGQVRLHPTQASDGSVERSEGAERVVPDLSTWSADDATDPVVPDSIAPEVPHVEPFNEQGEAVTDFEETIPVPTPRKGRNMPAAASAGILLLGIAVVAAWYDPRVFGLLLYSFLFAGVVEWRNVLRKQAQRLSLVPIAIATFGMGVATWYGAQQGPGAAEGLVVAMLIGCAGMVAWRVVDERIENTFSESVGSIFALMWIPFLGSFLMLLEVAEDGWQRVIILVVAVSGNDTGALFSGMAWGKHKLAPRVSPKKTWEGAVGGLILGTVCAGIVSYFFFDGQWWIGVAAGVAAAIASIIGDLAESALKRDMEVKDMSGIIPGHGGILDRIDSLLVAGPAVYVVFAIFM
ncbi:phosphatidate cytidylyltransferase [Demequina aurantiaca]|uniref:phosphatidate cytidylyltransferase n=1 Tax=Demequina aurantiaca TaxID=676200 RepID=UPI000A04B80D|nr:phosphatidate cytidylyltransferase [Demequina aurantiaca]